MKLKKLHLIISVLIVVPAALTYGLFPNRALPLLFDFEVTTVDLNNVFRAIMGLYFGVSVIWMLGIFKTEYWKTATILNAVFMCGLAFGRIISILVDGIPSLAFSLGTIGELVLGVFAVFQYKRYFQE